MRRQTFLSSAFLLVATQGARSLAACPVGDLEPGPESEPFASPLLAPEHATPAPRVRVPRRDSICFGTQLFDGGFCLRVEDLRVRGRGLDFVWARTYRSRSGPSTAQGNGWDYSYDLYVEAAGADRIVHDGTGRADVYALQPDGTWGADGFFRELEEKLDGRYTLRFQDGGSWSFHPLDGSAISGRVEVVEDRNQNQLSFAYDALGRLTAVRDTLYEPANGRGEILIAYDAQGRIASVTDFAGRSVTYAYYADGDAGGGAGDLARATSPAVLPNADFPFPPDPELAFPAGKSTVYTYTHGFPDERLNHDLASITDGLGRTWLANEYSPELDSGALDFDRLVGQTWGDAGERIDFVYVAETPAPENGGAVVRTIVNDRVGNVSEHFYDAGNREVLRRKYTGRAPDPDAPTTTGANRPTAPLRPSDPPYFETRFEYDADSLLARVVRPELDELLAVYELDLDPQAPRRARGNLRELVHVPGPRGGDQDELRQLFDYAAGTNLVTVHTDARGHATQHAYDARGNLLHTTHRVPEVVEDFTYDAFGRLATWTHPRNGHGAGARRVDRFEYHAAGPQAGYLEERVVDSGGEELTTRFEWNRVGAAIRIVDPLGGDELRDWNQLGQLVRTSSPEVPPGSGTRHARSFVRDAADQLVRVDVADLDEAGRAQGDGTLSTRYEYGTLGERLRVHRELGVRKRSALSGGLGAADAEVVTEAAYDANRNVVLERSGESVGGGQPANAVARSYDERDRLFREVRAPGDAAESTAQWDYDGSGAVVRVTRGVGVDPRATSSVYDGYDRLVESTDAMGNVRSWHYDANGNVGGERAPGVPNPFGWRVMGELVDSSPGSAGNVLLASGNQSYDALDRLLVRAEDFFDSAQQPLPGAQQFGLSTTSFEWSDDSRPTAVVDDRGSTTSFAYDPVGRLAETTDAKGNRRSFVYDAKSRVVERREHEVSDLQPGALDQEFVVSFEYDALDRLTARTDGAGNSTSHGYNSRGNRARTTDARGVEERFDYDGLDRLVRTVRDMDGDGARASDPDDVTTTQAWDRSSRLVLRIDGADNATRYDYDALDRLVRIDRADGSAWSGSYDVHDELVASTDPNGSVVAPIGYDALGRLRSRSVAPGPGVSSQTSFESYEYDGLSRMVRAEDDDSLVLRSYDSRSNVEAETTGAGTLVYEHDSVGNVLGLTYPGNANGPQPYVVSASYDALDRPQAIYDDPGGAPHLVATYAYVGPRRVQRRLLGNATRTDFVYDGLAGVPNAPGDHGFGRVARIEHRGPGGSTLLEGRAYRWSPTGRRVESVELVGGATLAMDYDALDRLVASARSGPGGHALEYELDGAGNRRSTREDGGPAELYLLDPQNGDAALNQYTETPFDARGYDANGNLVSRADSSGTRTLAYDFRDRLVSSDEGAVHAIYRYDALGRRTEKRVSAGGPIEVTRYAYDGWRVVEEQDAAGDTQATYVLGRGLDETISMRRGGVELYVHADDLQSTLALTNASGVVVERYEYGDFGAPTAPSLLGNPVLFAGRRYDAETGWYDLRHRVLDPRVGRFLTHDPLGDWGDAANRGNGLGYAANDPASRVDPFGLSEEEPLPEIPDWTRPGEDYDPDRELEKAFERALRDVDQADGEELRLIFEQLERDLERIDEALDRERDSRDERSGNDEIPERLPDRAPPGTGVPDRLPGKLPIPIPDPPVEELPEALVVRRPRVCDVPYEWRITPRSWIRRVPWFRTPDQGER